MSVHEIIAPRPGEVIIRPAGAVAPAADDVLVGLTTSLISTGTEVRCVLGDIDADTNWAEWVRYPFALGYSAAGRILAVGDAVRTLRVGQRVCGALAHRSQAIAAAGALTAIPDDISDTEAAWVVLARIAQVGVRRAALQLGERVVIIGAGIIGQLLTQFAALQGAAQVIVIDVAPRRLALALAHGATDALECDVADARPALQRCTAGALADVVFDATGEPAVLARATRLVRPLGRVVLIGDTTTPTRQTIGTRVVADSVAILGIHATMVPAEATPFNPWTPHAMDALFFRYLQRGRMRVADLVTHRYAPDLAPVVYGQLLEDRREFGGVVFDWPGAATDAVMPPAAR
ncbi:MAG: zinc-binding alcohol dehydrogenase [Chloroflexi bacterium]|nr:zinc-binding alcohol dehydrogenase [Chloroflexota bacterium]